jgi:hypothetical protein
MKVYHVAGAKYQMGQSLYCFDQLVQQGILTEDDWHWDIADYGMDADVVCVYETIEEAQEHQEELGGTVLIVDIPDDPAPFVLRRVAEGYLAVEDYIPAAWITPAN